LPSSAILQTISTQLEVNPPILQPLHSIIVFMVCTVMLAAYFWVSEHLTTCRLWVLHIVKGKFTPDSMFPATHIHHKPVPVNGFIL
jgi:hypothetical protein